MDESEKNFIKTMDEDLYEILGVERTSSMAEVRKQFLELSRKKHPDKNKDENEEEAELYKSQTMAYNILSNEEKRKVYDSSHFTFGFKKPIPKRNFQDIEMYIDFKMAFSGGNEEFKSLGYFRNKRGILMFGERTFNVEIPRGVSDGYVIICEGMGGYSEDGGKVIDIRITIRIKDDENFRIEGQVLFVKEFFTLKEALIGGIKRVRMPNGSFEDICIKQVIKPGKSLLISKRGMPIKRPNGLIKGDLCIECEIIFPEKITFKDMELIGETSL